MKGRIAVASSLFLVLLGAGACQKEVTRASNLDLERSQTGSAQPSRGSSSTQRPPASSGSASSQRPSSNDAQGEAATRPGPSQAPATPAPQTPEESGPQSPGVSAHRVDSVDDLPEWYRSLFVDDSNFVMKWGTNVEDPEVPGLNHRDYYTTNCSFRPVGPIDGMLAVSLTCDNEQDDFFQGYYVAAEEGVWLLERLPRSIEQFNRLLSDGSVYSTPLLPATPRASSLAYREGQRSVVFSLEPRDEGGWCRHFAVPSREQTIEYLYCLDDNGRVARAARQVSENGQALSSTSYEAWRGSLR